MEAVIAGLVGAVIGAGATLLASMLTRATERQRMLRESMIAQAVETSRALRASAFAIERLAEGRPELVVRWTDGNGKELQIDPNQRVLAEQGQIAELVASLHVLFHREVYSRAERALQLMVNAAAGLDELPASSNDVRRNVSEAREALAEFSECAGADLRFPVGVSRRRIAWDKHAINALAVERELREQGRTH